MKFENEFIGFEIDLKKTVIDNYDKIADADRFMIDNGVALKGMFESLYKGFIAQSAFEIKERMILEMINISSRRIISHSDINSLENVLESDDEDFMIVSFGDRKEEFLQSCVDFSLEIAKERMIG